MKLWQPDLHKELTSENALVIILGACLVLMGRHIYHVYNAGYWGYVAAIGLSVATMQFILRGHQWRGYMFAGLDMLYNLAFFDLLTPMLRGQLTADQADELLLSIAIPVVLAFYAHDYASKKTRRGEDTPHCEHIAESPVQEPRTLLEALGVPSVPLSSNDTIEQADTDMLTDGVEVYSDPLPPPPPKPKLLPKSKPTKSASPAPSNRQRVLAYLNQHGDMTASAIVEALGVPRGTASVYLAQWRSEHSSSVPSMATGD